MRLLKILIAMLVVSFIAAMLFNYPSAASQKKEVGFCANCHEMKPNYYTWLVTSHNQFGCLKCHEDIKITTFAYRHWKNAFQNPIGKKGIISDEVCESCHTNSRKVSPPGDIIFPHQLHVMKQIDCVDCHSNVTHMQVSHLVKDNPNIPVFSEVQAVKLIKKENQILMDVCMRCHNGDMASSDCSACHKNAKKDGKISK